jgi:uncharacterized protein (TIGR03437 family)
MKTLAATLVLCATALFADTAETVFFRGVMLPSNEVPAVPIQGASSALLVAHVVKDNSGKIVSGTVDFNVGYVFLSAVTLTGLHIHAAPAGVNGAIVIRTDLGSGAASIVSDNGIGSIAKPGHILTTDSAALDAINGMMKDPSQYYVNIHSTDYPGGAMRAQLQRAEVTVLMGIMSTANENPPITGQNASGVSQAVVIATRDAAGALTSGQVIFDINFNFGKQTTITGFHIHSGPAGVNGPVIINTGLGAGAASLATNDTGVGTFRKVVEVDMTKPEQVETLDGLLTHPKDYYINMHTTEFGGGLIRDQLRTTDLMAFNVTMLPSNETPPITGLDASAPAQVSIRTVRAEDGTVLAGVASFDVNYRFPVGRVEFTGLHVHDGAATVAGPVRLNSGLSATNSIVSETGFGNVYSFQIMNDTLAVATLNSLVANPENHYVNIHTTVNGGGAIRAQLAAANTALPVVSRGGNSANGTASAPAGLISITGTNLTKVAADLSGWIGKTLPTTFNGTKLTIGGKSAPILYVSPTALTAQVPVDVAAGSQPVVVTNSNGASTATNVTIAAPAPAIFADGAGRGFVTHQNFDLVLSNSPARSGELLIIWVTGLGQTTPALTTGGVVGFPPQADTAPVTVTIGGQDARVVYSIAAPGFPGLYQVAVTMPSGIAAGNAPLILRMGTVSSAAVNVAAQ